MKKRNPLGMFLLGFFSYGLIGVITISIGAIKRMARQSSEISFRVFWKYFKEVMVDTEATLGV